MIARVTMYQAKPEHIADLVAALDGIRAQISGLSGLVTSYTVWDDDGNGATFTVYDDVESADAAQTTVTSVWTGIAGFLVSGPEVREFSAVEKLAG